MLKNNNGFTLIEIIGVLLMIGILSAVVLTRSPGIDAELIGETDVVKSHIRYAQSMAMSYESKWGIEIISASTYALYKNGTPANRQLLPNENANTVTLPAGLTVAGLNPGDFLCFDKWGIPHTDSNCATPALNNTNFSIAKGGFNQSIKVTTNTGFVP